VFPNLHIKILASNVLVLGGVPFGGDEVMRVETSGIQILMEPYIKGSQESI
jgi:hypothetical protein